MCNRSLKQTAISLSSCEAKFNATSACAGEHLGLAELFKELHHNVSVRLDSDSARHILQRREPGGLKHIEIRCLAIQQWTREKRLSVERVDTKDNTADLLTKHLDGPRQETWTSNPGRYEWWRLRACEPRFQSGRRVSVLSFNSWQSVHNVDTDLWTLTLFSFCPASVARGWAPSGGAARWDHDVAASRSAFSQGSGGAWVLPHAEGGLVVRPSWGRWLASASVCCSFLEQLGHDLRSWWLASVVEIEFAEEGH